MLWLHLLHFFNQNNMNQDLSFQWKSYIILSLITKKFMLFVHLLVVSHLVMVPFIHTFMMALYLKPLTDLNAKTLFKMPFAIPLSLEICIGGVQMEHFLDAQKRKNLIKHQLTSMRVFVGDILMVFQWLEGCLGQGTIDPQCKLMQQILQSHVKSVKNMVT